MRFREKVFSPRLEQTVHSDEPAPQILTAKLIQNRQEAGRLFALRLGLPHRFGKCHGKTVEQIGIDFSERLPEDDQIADRAHRLGRPRRLGGGLEHLAAGPQQSAQQFEYSLVVKSLQHFVPGEQCLRVFKRCSVQS